MKLAKILLESSEDDLITFGFDLDYIQDVVDHLGSKYKEGQDYELHVGRGDTHPNAVTIKNPILHKDADLNDMLNAAQSDEDRYDSYDDENLNENEFAGLAAAIEKELKDKAPVEEAVGILGILSYILLSNTVAHMLSSMAKKIAKKQGWDKTEDIATSIYDWTHKNEQAFMSPIKRVLSVVMIGPTKKYIDPVTKGLYAIFIFFLAGQYGGAALDAVKNSKWGATAFNTVKSLVKGKEVHTLIRGVLSDVGILG